jgi:hypothetical protein
MRNTLLSPPLSSSDLEINPTFNVLITYEDFETGKHAKRTYDYLVQSLGHECRFEHQMWKFEVLGIPKLREMAAKDAVHADIIIVSSHGGDGLPYEVQEWIEAWRREKTNAIALVALFDCPQEKAVQTRPIRNYLAEVARRGAMGFFAQPDDWPGRQRREEQMVFEPPMDRSGKTLSTLAGIVQRDPSFPRWGINE